MSKVEFQTLKVGEEFHTVSNYYVKINESVAKRTEDHWVSSEHVWRFSPIDNVYTFNN
jgi:hypothetical protein